MIQQPQQQQNDCRKEERAIDRLEYNIKNYEREYSEYLEGGAVNRGETGAIYYDTEWEDFWSIQKILPMKFNRCIMYEGHLFHGAYHVDNNFKEYPRLGQACFIQINDAGRPMYQPML